LFGLVFTLAVTVVPAMPSAVPGMPSASVTCPGWPASCDGAWGAVVVDDDSADAPAQAATDDGPRDYATPAEIDCPTPPEPPALPSLASGECSEPPLNLWYRVSRFPDSERPPESLVPAPRRARSTHGISSGGAQDVGHWSAPDVQPLALFGLPGFVATGTRTHSDISSRTIPARALAPPDRPPRA
jgi:hypothetical protein